MLQTLVDNVAGKRLCSMHAQPRSRLPAFIGISRKLVCVCRPYTLYKMLCSAFMESNSNKLILQDLVDAAFCKALEIWSSMVRLEKLHGRGEGTSTV
jgi:hypothetical protein